MTTKTAAQIAYDAYAQHQQWVNYAGQPLPRWEAVRQDIRDAWAEAADAVIDHWEEQHDAP